MEVQSGPKTFLSVKKPHPNEEEVGYKTKHPVEEESILTPNTTLSDTGQNKYG